MFETSTSVEPTAAAVMSAPRPRTFGERLSQRLLDFVNGTPDLTITPTPDDERYALAARDGALEMRRPWPYLFAKNLGILLAVNGVVVPISDGQGALFGGEPRRILVLGLISLPIAALVAAFEHRAVRRVARKARRTLIVDGMPSLDEAARRVAWQRREFTSAGWLRRGLLRAVRASVAASAMMAGVYWLLRDTEDTVLRSTGAFFGFVLVVAVASTVIGRRMFLASWERGRHYVPLPSDVDEAAAGGRVGLPHADAAPFRVPPAPRG